MPAALARRMWGEGPACPPRWSSRPRAERRRVRGPGWDGGWPQRGREKPGTLPAVPGPAPCGSSPLPQPHSTWREATVPCTGPECRLSPAALPVALQGLTAALSGQSHPCTTPQCTPTATVPLSRRPASRCAGHGPSASAAHRRRARPRVAARVLAEGAAAAMTRMDHGLGVPRTLPSNHVHTK